MCSKICVYWNIVIKMNVKKLFDMSGKTVIITGAAGLLGSQYAEGLINSGANVVLADLNYKLCKEIGERLVKKKDSRALAVKLDLTDKKSIQDMVKKVIKKYSTIDVLINNAGANYTLSPVVLVPFESALKTIMVNFMGTFLFSREAIKIMKLNTFGRIINFGSMALKHEVKGEAIYTASKAATASFTRVLAKEVYSYGITCNVISPSAVDTDLMKNVNSDALKEVLSRNAISDVGNFEDINNIIDFLIKPESYAITGQTVFLGGV